MEKRIDWVLMQGNGKPLWGPRDGCSTRVNARQIKKELEEEIFEEWNKDVVHPLTIVRREWHIVSEKRAR